MRVRHHDLQRHIVWDAALEALFHPSTNKRNNMNYSHYSYLEIRFRPLSLNLRPRYSIYSCGGLRIQDVGLRS